MSSEKVDRTIARLASEILERNRGSKSLVVFGIKRRGAEVAKRLATELSRIDGQPVESIGLDVSSFRDDKGLASELTKSNQTENGGDGSSVSVANRPTIVDGAVDVTDRDVLLVDDVLYTGRTARAALDAIVQLGRPKSIQFLALIDRGHREYPIQPDYVGRLLQTKDRERIEVAVESGFAVWVED